MLSTKNFLLYLKTQIKIFWLNKTSTLSAPHPFMVYFDYVRNKLFGRNVVISFLVKLVQVLAK